MGERVLAPAAAYYHMEEIMGPTWFLCPIPASGVSVVVVGKDKVATCWAMTHSEYQRVAAAIAANPDIRASSVRNYTGNSDIK